MQTCSPSQQATITIHIDDKPFAVQAGISLVAALLSCGIKTLRHSPQGFERGAFCMMGVCQECVIQVDGQTQQACLLQVQSDMRVELGHAS